MTTFLLPRLAETVARELVGSMWKLTPPEARRLASTVHSRQTFASVGTRLPTQTLTTLAEEMRAAAEVYGYPNEFPNDVGARSWDALATKAVWRHLDKVAPADASRTDTWSFVATVVVPDLVLWRYSSATASSLTSGLVSRFLGGRRNLVRRFWLRGRALQAASLDGLVLNELREDDLVQIFERPSLAAVPALAGEVIRLLAQGSYRNASARDILKRLNRELALTAMYALPPDAVRKLVEDVAKTSDLARKAAGVRMR